MNKFFLDPRMRLAWAIMALAASDATMLLEPGAWSSLLGITTGLPVTLILPGLFLLIILGARRLSTLVLTYSAALSVLMLMLVGLAANFLPLVFNVARPLDSSAILWIFNGVYVLLAGLAVWKLRREKLDLSAFKRPNRYDVGLSIASLITIALASGGAIVLNNDGSNLPSIIAAAMVVTLVPLSLIMRRHLQTGSLLFAIFAMTVSILLATSLRGWYATGQDLQHEFQVFNLAIQLGIWDIGRYKDPYNACLSITLLPVVISKLLHIDGLASFKLIIPLLFAAVPLTIFATVRQFLGRSKAFIAAVFFIGLPTLSIDVPFITRQEVAFVFVATAMAAVFDSQEPWIKRHRNLLFILMAAGVILSHYSTAYLFVGTLMLAFGLYLCVRLVKFFAKARSTKTKRKRKAKKVEDSFAISAKVVIVIALLSYGWLAQATKVSGDLQTKLGHSLQGIHSIINAPMSVLHNFQKPNPSGDALTEYVKATSIEPNVNAATIAKGLQVVSSDLPPTSMSLWIQKFTGVALDQLVNAWYYGGTKLYLLLIGIGTLVLGVQKWRKRYPATTILIPIWSVAASIILAVQIVLPGIAENYGITRAFMQAFIILVIPMAIGLDAILSKFGKRVAKVSFASVSVVLLMIYSGLLPQLTGGLHRQLSFGNSGQYYGTVYPDQTDLAAYAWIMRNVPAGSKINIPDYAALYAYYPLSLDDTTSAGILPFQVKTGDYALLSQSQTQDKIVYSFASLIGIKMPDQIYDNSDLIYSNGKSELYRKATP